MHSRRVSRNLGLAAAVVLGIAAFAGCHDSPVDPFAASPAGRYELIGCNSTYDPDTTAVHACGDGGSINTTLKSRYVLLNADGTASRNSITTVTTWMWTSPPVSYAVTDTEVLLGQWTAQGREVTAVWTNLPYAASTVFTRVEPDLIREGESVTDIYHVWYRRTP